LEDFFLFERSDPEGPHLKRMRLLMGDDGRGGGGTGERKGEMLRFLPGPTRNHRLPIERLRLPRHTRG